MKVSELIRILQKLPVGQLDCEVMLRLGNTAEVPVTGVFTQVMASLDMPVLKPSTSILIYSNKS